MNLDAQPLMIFELIQKCRENPDLLKEIPEFDFIKSVVEKVRSRGCFCGVNEEISNSIPKFNFAANNLNQEAVERIKKVLNREKLCFGILENGSFKNKCYD